MTHDSDWFVITVRPGMERATAAAVHRMGWEAFLPGYRKVVPTFSRKRGGKGPNAKPTGKEERLFVSWPGYLWIGAPAGRQPWQKVLASDMVTGVIMYWRPSGDGRWEAWPLKLPKLWRREKALREVEDIAFRELVLGPAPPVDYEVGQDVLITNAVFFQFKAKCVFLDDDKKVARVLLRMLGSEREVKIDATEAMRHDDSPSPKPGGDSIRSA